MPLVLSMGDCFHSLFSSPKLLLISLDQEHTFIVSMSEAGAWLMSSLLVNFLQIYRALF